MVMSNVKVAMCVILVEDSTLLMLRVTYKIVFGDLSSHIKEYINVQ
jgi:hypothetical protein